MSFCWCLICLIACVFDCLLVWLLACLIACLFDCFFVCLSVCLVVCLSVCLSVWLVGWLVVCLFVCSFVRLFVCHVLQLFSLVPCRFWLAATTDYTFISFFPPSSHFYSCFAYSQSFSCEAANLMVAQEIWLPAAISLRSCWLTQFLEDDVRRRLRLSFLYIAS